MVGLDPQRRLQLGLRLFQFARIESNVPKRPMGRRVVLVQRYRLPGTSEPEDPVGFGSLSVIDRCPVVGDREACVGLRGGRIERNGLGEESPREIVPARRVHEQNAPAHKEVVRFDVRRAAARGRRGKRQHVREGGDDLAHHLVLQGEDVRQVAVEPLGPEMPVHRRLGELNADPDPARGPAHAAPDDVSHAQLPGDRPDVGRPGCAEERRIAWDHQ